jgi:hypothetical protein
MMILKERDVKIKIFKESSNVMAENVMHENVAILSIDFLIINRQLFRIK